MFYINTGSTKQLVIYESNSGKIGWSRDIVEGEVIELNYTHSVTGYPVKEVYRCEGNCLVLTCARYAAPGAGLGFAGDGFERWENGWSVIDGMHRELKTLPLRISSVKEQFIIYRGNKWHMWDYFSPMTLVKIEIKSGIKARGLFCGYCGK